MEARLAAGEHREVVAEAEARVAEEPLREHRWAILALAQWRSGRQADALRSLHIARRRAEALPAALECPYKGLAPYEAADADSFFGRDDEVNACLRRLDCQPGISAPGQRFEGPPPRARTAHP